METIEFRRDETLYALVCRRDPRNQIEGTRFITSPNDEFQVGVIVRPAGATAPVHNHPRQSRTIHGVSEFLYVERGCIELDIFDDNWQPLGSTTLQAGDFCLLHRGGHALRFVEDSTLIEVKQGPYPGDAAAKCFPPGP